MPYLNLTYIAKSDVTSTSLNEDLDFIEGLLCMKICYWSLKPCCEESNAVHNHILITLLFCIFY